ncbi:MAG: YHS domain-containing (seleno)protein, partial [Cyanobacteria bacterium P01_D01_bin.1]
YAPEYGGFCAWAVAAKDTLVPTDPNAWSVVDNKLYLNANQRVQATWEEDIQGFIAQADNKWPALAQ